MSNRWMKMLAKLDGAVQRDYDPFNYVLRTHSPSVNFIFGNTHGVPRGYTAVLYGPPKSGKSLLVNDFIGQMHLDDPEGIAIKYNTEMRETGQLTERQQKIWGIDPNRYMAFDTNNPKEIFDAIEKDINAMCQEGAPVRLIAIDSITGIVGRRMGDADSIMNQQIGDDAKTIQDGLKRILATIRRNRITLLLTSHVRAEMDPNKAKYTPTKMAGSWGLKHFAEYFISVEPNNSAEGKKALDGKTEFVDSSVKDMMGKGEKTGHKIRVTMRDSSVGPKGRVGEFTLDYHNGIINKHEEIFLLATRRNVAEHSGKSYIVKDFPTKGEEQRYVGKMDFATAIRDNEMLAQELIKRVREQDVDAMKNGRTVTGAVNMAEDDDENASGEESVE